MTGSNEQLDRFLAVRADGCEPAVLEQAPNGCEYLDLPFELKSASQVTDRNGSGSGVFEGLEFAFGFAAVHGSELVDDEDAVEVIDLVLPAACEETGGASRDAFAGEQGGLHLDG